MSSMKASISQREEYNDQFSIDILEQKIYSQLAAMSGHISRLSYGDADVFRDAFRCETPCYANSWLYMLRSTRNDQGGLGYKLVGNDTVMGIGYRNNTLYLVHPVGAGRFDTTLDFCYRIRRSIPYPLVLKKIDQKLYEYLYATNLFRQHVEGLTAFEEEAFPEHTLYLDQLYTPNFSLDPRSLPLIRKVKRLEKGSMRLLAKTDVSSIENYPGFHALFGSNPDKYRSYLNIIKEISSQRPGESKYKICVYVDEQGTMHGLYISERLGEACMGLYCAVSSRSHPGITEWMDYDFFRQLFHEGIHYLYLGGSETAGVHAYIQKKLLPLAPLHFMRPMEMYSNEELFFLSGAGVDGKTYTCSSR